MFEYKEEYKYLSNVVINVTDDCNLQCKYCFVEQQPHYMTLDTAKFIIDYLYQNLNKKKELNIIPPEGRSRVQFFGGEPLLCYNSIIVPLVEYCNNKYPNSFVFGITTNGTLLNTEIIDFLYENNFDILLSIDGDQTTQDYNRPCKNCNQSSFDLIIKNIPYLLEKFPNICFRSTIYAPTVEHLFENYLYAEKLGFKNWEAIEDSRHEWTDDQIEILKNEIMKIYFYRLQQVAKGILPMECSRIEQWQSRLYDFLQDPTSFTIEESQDVHRCGLGTNIGSIGWDGSIYGCQEQVSKKDKNLFYIGNIFKGGIDVEKHKQLLQFYYENQTIVIQKEECQQCPIQKMCELNLFLCPSSTYDILQDMTSMTKVSCELQKAYYYNTYLLFYTLIKVTEENNIIGKE